MTPERLAALRKTFGGMTTEELRAIAEGRKKTSLSEETLGAIRLLLVERKEGGYEEVELLNPPASEESGQPKANPAGAATRPDPDPAAPEPHPPASGKRKLLTGIGVLLVAVLALLALPATRDELHWLRVSDDESVADEQAYLGAWPEGRHAGEARLRIERQAWSEAVGLDSIEGFQSFLAAFRQGGHVTEAQARIEALKWEAAVTANDITQFRGFLREHPASPHAPEARERIEARRWEAVLFANVTKNFEEFLREYPNSRHAPEARAKIEALTRLATQAGIERDRKLRSQLADIFVLEGAGGDGSGRDWPNACGSLKLIVEGSLKPGAKIHHAAGVIQEFIAIPDNIHLVCGYGRNAQGVMEWNPKAHRVFMMPPPLGDRSITVGRGCEVWGLWLGMQGQFDQTGRASAYAYWPSFKGPAMFVLGDVGIKVRVDGGGSTEFYDPGSQQIKGNITWLGGGASGFHLSRGATQTPARLDRPPF